MTVKEFPNKQNFKKLLEPRRPISPEEDWNVEKLEVMQSGIHA